MQKTKIVTGVLLFIFFVIITSVLTAGIIKREKSKSDSIPVNNNSEKSLGNNLILNEEEVLKHSTQEDCWIIINGYVYEVTKYIIDHPGGKDQIIPFCGKDATNAFETKGKNPGSKHSNVATGTLTNYLLGKLGDTLGVKTQNTETVTSVSNKASNPPISVINNTGIILTTEEIAKHASSSDCWMIISGKVYNFTSYITKHPGGSIMIPYCGKDGTLGFQTQGGKGSHSAFASSLFASYFIGDLGSNASNISQPSNILNIPQNTTSQNTNGQNLPSAILNKYSNAIYIKGEYEDDGKWEGKIDVSGQCRAIKVNSSNMIIEDKNC